MYKLEQCMEITSSHSKNMEFQNTILASQINYLLNGFKLRIVGLKGTSWVIWWYRDDKIHF